MSIWIGLSFGAQMSYAGIVHWTSSSIQQYAAESNIPLNTQFIEMIWTGKHPVMLSPRGKSGLKAKILASASRLWPRPGLDLVVLLCNRAFFGQKSCKIREFC